jgi:hypothetical protein
MSPWRSFKLKVPVVALFLGFLCFFVCVRVPTVVMGQNASPAADPTPTPTPNPTLIELDKRLAELEKLATIRTKEKEIAVSEAERVTAEKNKILNALPTPTATPLTGEVKVTGEVGFQGELLVYKSLNDIANGIGADMKNVTGSVVIYNDADINALQAYAIILTQIKNSVDQYKALNQRLNPGDSEEVGLAAIFAAPQAASTLLRSVADVAALFRTDTTITGLSINVDEAVLNSLLAESLRLKNLNVFEPALFLPNLFKQPDSEIIKQLGNLNLVKTRGEQAVADFEALKPEAQNASIKKPVIARMRALNTQVDAFLTNLMTIDEKSKKNALTGLYRAERIKNLLEDKQTPTYVLHLKMAKAEGVRTTKSNLFTGTKLSYSGGIIVSYTLFDRDGQIVRSGIRGSYRGSQNNKLNDRALLTLP